MDSIVLNANAKINLSLDVLGKRQDGYHEVRMIMQAISLHDIVSIEVIDSGIEVSCNRNWVPTGEKNIAYKAAILMLEKYSVKKGLRIGINKNIPVAAGLAGGSTDAAAVLTGINNLFNLGINDNELMLLGKQIGADVPFCLKGGTALSEGIGEKLTYLHPFKDVSIVLVKPRVSVSTAWVYSNLEIDKITSRPDTDFLIKAIEFGDINKLAQNMKNVLEDVTINKYCAIKEIKELLVENGALGSMMSGSGPTVFGIFENIECAKKAFGNLRDGKWECYIAETICEER